jgi:peptide/bleomycin uptake transporter
VSLSDLFREALAQIALVLARGFFGGNWLHFFVPACLLVFSIMIVAPRTRMLGAYFGERKWRSWSWGGGLLLLYLIYAQVQFSVVINDWYGSFYNLFQNPQKHSVSEFWVSLRMFLWITIPWVAVWALTRYLTSMYALRWREALTTHYLPRWCQTEGEIEGASQRIQEDAAKFAEMLESLGLALVRTLMTLLVFTGVLWTLSENVNVPFISGAPSVRVIGGKEVVINYIPGSLVWLAVLTSVGGTLLSLWFGKILRLVGLEYNNQKAEAAFRKPLVYGEDSKRDLAILPELLEKFTGVRLNYQQLYLNYSIFNLWLATYGQLMSVIADVFAAPGIFAGLITLGVLMQINNAFAKVHAGFSFFAENWPAVTKFLSVMKRLNEFERNLDKHEARKS